MQTYSVVLDVAEEAEYVAFGVLLAGAGTVWIEDFAFDETAADTPVTGTERQRDYPDSPTNLGFN